MNFHCSCITDAIVYLIKWQMSHINIISTKTTLIHLKQCCIHNNDRLYKIHRLPYTIIWLHIFLSYSSVIKWYNNFYSKGNHLPYNKYPSCWIHIMHTCESTFSRRPLKSYTISDIKTMCNGVWYTHIPLVFSKCWW